MQITNNPFELLHAIHLIVVVCTLWVTSYYLPISTSKKWFVIPLMGLAWQVAFIATLQFSTTHPVELYQYSMWYMAVVIFIALVSAMVRGAKQHD